MRKTKRGTEFIANFGVKTETMEMQAILNYFGPAFIGLLLLILFLVEDYIFPRSRIPVMILFIIINLAFGLFIRSSS